MYQWSSRLWFLLGSHVRVKWQIFNQLISHLRTTSSRLYTMTICTRSSVRNLNSTLPRGWKKIVAHKAHSSSQSYYYISPEGKRFATIQSAKSWIIATIEAFENSEIIESPRKACRRMNQLRAQNERQFEMNNFRLVMSERIKKRRKDMADRNPYKNLLKTTLKKNYKVRVRQDEIKKNVTLLKRLNPRARLADVLKKRKPSLLARLQRREGWRISIKEIINHLSIFHQSAFHFHIYSSR